MHFKIKKGLDIPLEGIPNQTITRPPVISKVAVLGDDFVGFKPRMLVAVGDKVSVGDRIMEDKANEGVYIVSQYSGKVVEINRGFRRKFLSLVIEIEKDKKDVSVTNIPNLVAIQQFKVEDIVKILLKSGDWLSFRTRPLNKIPNPKSRVDNIFVSTLDTRPLAPKPKIILEKRNKAFNAGLTILAKLANKRVYLCRDNDDGVKLEKKNMKINEAFFAGPHPAGLPGTHMNFIAPVSEENVAWFIGYQEVIAIGNLFMDGKVDTTRYISLAGLGVKNPRLLKVPVGSNISELIDNDLNVLNQFEAKNWRIISGSVLNGHNTKEESGAMDYLSRYHYQISIIPEGDIRELFGWLKPGLKKFSITGAYLSKFFGARRFNINTNTNGSDRAMVPLGNFEKVVPLDVLPTQLLRYLLVGDIEMAKNLGALELDEEDLALCTFVCSGKYDYCYALRNVLNRIEKEML